MRKTVRHLLLYYWSKLHIHILTRRDRVSLLALTKGTFCAHTDATLFIIWGGMSGLRSVKCHLQNAVTRSATLNKPIKPNWQDCSNRSDTWTPPHPPLTQHTHTRTTVIVWDFSKSVCVLLSERMSLILTVTGEGRVCRSSAVVCSLSEQSFHLFVYLFVFNHLSMMQFKKNITWISYMSDV